LRVAPYAGILGGPGTDTVALSVIGEAELAGVALLVGDALLAGDAPGRGGQTAVTLKSPGACSVTSLPYVTWTSPCADAGVAVGAPVGVAGACTCGSCPPGIVLPPPLVLAHAASPAHAKAKSRIPGRKRIGPPWTLLANNPKRGLA
jgi:hypothetical protein